MGGTFRESMAWLHTWAGVVLGALLFAIFWMGTLSVFDKEIDRWMIPETRFAWSAGDAADYSYDAALEAVRRQLDIDKAQDLLFTQPQARRSVAEFSRGTEGPLYLHPRTHEHLHVTETDAGSGFLYPFHYTLHLGWKNQGIWLVGLASMAMLALFVSGVVIHRKIFVDFFTFRWQRKLPRSTLDLHNLSGVLGLPFHFVITLSGLIIFFGTYFPSVEHVVYGDDNGAFGRGLYEPFYEISDRQPAGRPAPLASLDMMAAEAAARWNGEPARMVWVFRPGDANSDALVYRTRAQSVERNYDMAHFDAATGTFLQAHTPTSVVHVQRFISGLHFIQFDHWPLRWIYFVLGLSGCVMIATGYIYWLETRRKRHAKLGLPGVRIVEGLTVGSVTGIVIATLAFFIANRLLPLGASLAGIERAALEIWAFYLVWLATFARAGPGGSSAGRSRRWRCWPRC